MAKFILGLFIFLFSILLSGIMILLDVHKIIGIPFIAWLIVFSVVGYLYFRYKFKKLSTFRYFLIRTYIRLNLFFKKIDSKVTYHEESLTSPMQEKAVRLWKLCLKDKDSNISCSISNQTRQIEKNNLLIILSPLNQVDFLMSILDIDSDKNCMYEIRIGQNLSETIITLFDNENEKRMRQGEDEKRKSIYNDLDKLLLQQENALNKK